MDPSPHPTEPPKSLESNTGKPKRAHSKDPTDTKLTAACRKRGLILPPRFVKGKKVSRIASLGASLGYGEWGDES